MKRGIGTALLKTFPGVFINFICYYEIKISRFELGNTRCPRDACAESFVSSNQRVLSTSPLSLSPGVHLKIPLDHSDWQRFCAARHARRQKRRMCFSLDTDIQCDDVRLVLTTASSKSLPPNGSQPLDPVSLSPLSFSFAIYLSLYLLHSPKPVDVFGNQQDNA